MTSTFSISEFIYKCLLKLGKSTYLVCLYVIMWGGSTVLSLALQLRVQTDRQICCCFSWAVVYRMDRDDRQLQSVALFAVADWCCRANVTVSRFLQEHCFIKCDLTSSSNITTGVFPERRDVLALVLLQKRVFRDVILCHWEPLAQWCSFTFQNSWSLRYFCVITLTDVGSSICCPNNKQPVGYW